MVVRFIRSDDLYTLEEKINKFILEKEKDFMIENPSIPILRFDVKLEVISMNSPPHYQEYVAVIQY